eukprot:TRINITY_DN10318_c0_g1_i2.p1 TRINITY_DN10318_c0_g1~~TRINITY_DN10318_c0_g1_i2.p1  ORF type:complete len:428 (+),score=105.74 TRINITY_DN10318_c0_g1_i2:903-2186(+)
MEPVIRGQLSAPALAAHEHVPHVHHVMLDFDVKTADNKASELAAQLVAAVKSAQFLELDSSAPLIKLGQHGWVQLVTGSSSANTALIKYHNQFLTIDLHFALAAGSQPPKDTDLNSLKTAIMSICQPSSVKSDKLQARNPAMLYPPVVRGGAFNAIVPTTDGLLIQYDFDELVFHQKSKYQDVKIYHSNQFGNMLLLDDDPNLAESDLSYTTAILGSGRYEYRGKHVLILGGGDGGILNEVLKLEPANVIMLEIDEVVVNAAVKYLRGICGSSMDELTGENYEVRLTDCIPELDEMIQNGDKFDFVINDLTAIPVTHAVEGSDWDFLQLVLGKAIQVLKPNGKYITQGNSVNMPQALEQYESVIDQLKPEMGFSKVTFLNLPCLCMSGTVYHALSRIMLHHVLSRALFVNRSPSAFLRSTKCGCFTP